MAGWLLTLVSLGLLAAPAAAGHVPGAVSSALETLRSQVRREAWPQALEALRVLERELAAVAPLEISDVQVLASAPQGLGMYTPLVDGVVHGDELFVYAEVRNHGIAEVAGFYEVHLGSDLIILDSQGQELARDEGFGESHFTARVPHRPTFVSIALRTRGLPAGAYRLRLILHDRIGRKTAQGEVPFRIPERPQGQHP